MGMDLSKLSDADLEAVSKGDMSKVSDDGLKFISGGETAAKAEPVKFKVGPLDIELKNVKSNPSKNSWLYDFVTGAQGKNAVEPTTAAQIMAPVPMAGTAKIATELGEGVLATSNPATEAMMQAAKYGKKILPYAAGAVGAGAISRRLGAH